MDKEFIKHIVGRFIEEYMHIIIVAQTIILWFVYIFCVNVEGVGHVISWLLLFVLALLSILIVDFVLFGFYEVFKKFRESIKGIGDFYRKEKENFYKNKPKETIAD
jgi:hypothetical protein